MFQTLDFGRLGSLIRDARNRVLLCIPGFDDEVATAVIDAHRRLGAGNVEIIIDADDRAARLGYGYFDALKMVHDNGVGVRVEPGVRLGVVVIDSLGWCFSVPAQMVDATMEKAQAPNAIQLSLDQVNATANALVRGTRPSLHSLQSEPKVEIGKEALTPEVVKQIEKSLEQSPPQRFDIARKVNVFNAFLEFVELEVTGVEIKRLRVQLPQDLLLAVTDGATRRKLSTNFQLIDETAKIHQQAVRLRRRADEIRKTHTRVLPRFGAVVLRSSKARLEADFQLYKEEVESFASTVESEIGKELERSRAGLVRALLPGFREASPPSLLAEIVGPVTDTILERWLNRRLDRIFPTPEGLRTQMRATLVFKAITYETLKDIDFRKAVRAAYPDVDFEKPLEEFVAAKQST